MKALQLAAASTVALSLAGCGSSAQNSAVVTGRLDCPGKEGAMTRVSAAADGKSCVYRINDGAEVTLRLVPVAGGDPAAALAQIEAQLKAETQPKGDAAGAEQKAPPAAAADAGGSQSETADDKVKWDDKAIEARVDAKLREKGIAVDGDDKTQTAHVNMPGIHITAEGDKANVNVGPIHINANGSTATVDSLKYVSMRGEGFSREKRGIRAMFVYAGDDLGAGYKYVGYEASGPRTGPLAVAIVKSKSDGGFHGDIYGDVKRLVRRNGGT